MLSTEMKVFLLTVTFAICQAVINQDYDKIIRELSARLTESQVSPLSKMLCYLW